MARPIALASLIRSAQEFLKWLLKRCSPTLRQDLHGRCGIGKVSKGTTTEHHEAPGQGGRFGEIEGYTVAFRAVRRGPRPLAAVQGLLNDHCQCPHLGLCHPFHTADDAGASLAIHLLGPSVGRRRARAVRTDGHPTFSSPAVATLRLVTTLRDRLDRCDADLRRHLDPDEQIVATGRCEDITERGGPEPRRRWLDIGDGHGSKVRWVPHVDLRFEASLDLDDVTGVSERLVGHRYAITLEHPSIARLRSVPAHQFLMFEWGNAVEKRPLARTVLALNRRDTEAACALREQLTTRGSL